MRLLLFCLLLGATLAAQDQRSFRERTDFKVGYFGNLIYNQGLNFGMEYHWLEKVNIRERRRGTATTRYQLLFNGSLGYSTNFNTATQNGFFGHSGLILRRVNTKSREISLELNPLGFHRSVLPHTYEVFNNEVNKIVLPGRTYYAPSIAIGLGRFRRATKKSGWHLNAQLSILTDYNADWIPIYSFHFGRKF